MTNFHVASSLVCLRAFSTIKCLIVKAGMFSILLFPSLSVAQYDMNPGNFGVMTNFHVASSLPSKAQIPHPDREAFGKTWQPTKKSEQSKGKHIGSPTISFMINILDLNVVFGPKANSSAIPKSMIALQVILLNCKDLPDTDDTWLGLFESSPDPHIRVSLSTNDKTQTSSTHTIWQQNDPEFNNSVTFQVGKAELKDGSLSLDVLDWDFTCYRKIGNIQVNLDDTRGATSLPLKMETNLPCS